MSDAVGNKTYTVMNSRGVRPHRQLAAVGQEKHAKPSFFAELRSRIMWPRRRNSNFLGGILWETRKPRDEPLL